MNAWEMVSNSIVMHSKITDFPKKKEICIVKCVSMPKSKIIYSQGDHRLSEKRCLSLIIKRVITTICKPNAISNTVHLGNWNP